MKGRHEANRQGSRCPYCTCSSVEYRFFHVDRLGQRSHPERTTAIVSAIDVARYILDKRGMMTAMKLQKLVYYSQAWSLVWDERPLFPEQIQAWMNGPVVRELYDEHKGKFSLSALDIGGNPLLLDETAKETIDAVLDFYGDKSAQWLSDLTHKEAPWQRAREGVGVMDNSERPIEHEWMADYYMRVAQLTNASK